MSDSNGSLQVLFDSLRDVQDHGLPPIEQWQPENEGSIDISIRADGSWWHEGGEIKRHKLVKLFASILLCEDQQHFLITPVEKLRIQVEDAPLLIVESRVTEANGEPGVVVRTNLDDVLTLSKEHCVEIRNDIPYLYVRRGLWARVNRSVYYEWAELGSPQEIDGMHCLALRSEGQWFPIGLL